MSTLFNKKFMKVPNIPFLKSFREIGRNAFVDWLLIMLSNVLIMLVLVLGGVYLYWQISSGNFSSSDTGEVKDDKTFDQKGLESVVNMFNQRKENSEQIKGGYKETGDPSL